MISNKYYEAKQRVTNLTVRGYYTYDAANDRHWLYSEASNRPSVAYVIDPKTLKEIAHTD